MRLAGLAAIALGVFLALTASDAAFAQQPFSAPPNAPIPAPILAAKKVFISNATGETVLPPGNPDLTYNEFYSAMNSWGRYQLVGSPAEADLVFEIRLTSIVGTTRVIQGSGGTGQDFQFRLVIFDSKSHVVLWAFSQSIPSSTNKTKNSQLFDQTMLTLVNDLKQWTVRAGSSSPS
jgi:hypothetical protein